MGTSSKPPVFCLMGPTAAGKTDLALQLADRGNFELVSVDSAQVYRGMDIGTGKPDAATLARFPHHLIDIRDPADPYSVAEFRHDALQIMEAIHKKGSLPLLVGGTMLYFRALRDGLADMPRADPEIRRTIAARARAEGWPAVHDWLQSLDPETARRIHPNDPQRLQRALEVNLVSGRTLTEIQDGGENAQGNDKNLPFSLHFFAIQPSSRPVLHARIAARFQQMIADGLIEEVGELYDRGDLHDSLPSMKSVGYRQIWQYLEGSLDYDEMIERGIIATRQLAKRQLTWLRSWKNLICLDGPESKNVETVLKFADSIAR